MANITVASDGAEQNYALEAPSVTLGRGLESDIRLKDIKSSRRHCTINKTPQGYELSDLSSGNGTFLNGVQVKKQILNNGDKIQIGSTTITFHGDGQAKPAAGTGKIARSQAAARPATATKGIPRPTTAQLPVAPTRKITAKADAVKPASTAMPKPKTQPIGKKSTRSIGKTGTGPIDKPRTGGIKKTTGRAPTARGSKTQKFHAEGRKKKVNPVGLIIGFIGVVLLVVVGWMFVPKGLPNEVIQDQVNVIIQEANALDSAGKYDQAIAKYNEALAKIEGNDFFKTSAIDFKARISQIKVDQAAIGEANKEFRALQDEFKNAKGADAHHDLLKKAKSLRDRSKDSDVVTWKGDLQILIEKIEKFLDTEAATNKRLDFQVRRNEIMANCKLSGDPNKALWGQAITEWNAYLGEEIADISKTKADNEIRVINNRARDSFRTVQRRASRMVESNQKADAIELLKKEADRFKGTESEAELQTMLKELDT